LAQAIGIWWTAFKQRAEETAVRMPRELKGTILFEVCGPGIEVEYRAVRIDGPKIELFDQWVPHDDACVSIQSEVLEHVLEGEGQAQGFEVWGDEALVRGLFNHFASQPTSKNWLSIRGGG
jgi:hypothetical protein